MGLLAWIQLTPLLQLSTLWQQVPTLELNINRPQIRRVGTVRIADNMAPSGEEPHWCVRYSGRWLTLRQKEYMFFLWFFPLRLDHINLLIVNTTI